MQGADARDALLGRVFGYAAFAQGGRAADCAVASRLISSLLDISGRKSFLNEAVTASLLATLEGLPELVLAQVLAQHEELRETLSCEPSEATPEVC